MKTKLVGYIAELDKLINARSSDDGQLVEIRDFLKQLQGGVAIVGGESELHRFRFLFRFASANFVDCGVKVIDFSDQG